MATPHFQQTDYGFEYGSAKVTRIFNDENGSVIIGIGTEMQKQGIFVRVTKAGRILVRRYHNNAKLVEANPKEGK